jgi:cytochrome c551/c552
LLLMLGVALLLSACQRKEDAERAAKEAPSPAELISNQPIVHGPEIKNVELKNPLDQAWVAGGKTVYDTKCMPCHKLDGTKLVGPGWKEVTKRRAPVWIMNMICNTDMMLAQDAEAQKQLELCLVRMPNQNVSVEDARKVLEFMRSNDGEK